MAGAWLRGGKGTWRCGGPALTWVPHAGGYLLAYRQLAALGAGAACRGRILKAGWIEEPVDQP